MHEQREQREQVSATKGENRLSFDFCELNADQLLESTPHSYRMDYKYKKKDGRQSAFN